MEKAPKKEYTHPLDYVVTVERSKPTVSSSERKKHHQIQIKNMRTCLKYIPPD